MTERKYNFVENALERLTIEQIANLPKYVAKVIEWRVDITKPEFISAAGYHKSYLNIGNPSISQHELDLVVISVNAAFASIYSGLRVDDSMGEIIPILV